MVKEVFKDPVLQLSLEKNGYVCVPFLDKASTIKLRELYLNNPFETDGPYSATVFNNDIEYRERIHNSVKEIFASSLDRIFLPEYQVFLGSFAVKSPGANTQWNLHQDWTFVDERQYGAVGVWCPVQDVDFNNGCLGVVPGSHKFFFNIRGSNTIAEYAEISQKIERESLTFLPIKAGEAVIFYNNLLHYSSPNISNSKRITGACVMLHREARIVHYYRHPTWDEETVEVFEIDTDFMLHNNYMSPERPTRGVSLGKKRHVTEKITDKQFSFLVRKYSDSWFDRFSAKIWSTKVPNYPSPI